MKTPSYLTVSLTVAGTTSFIIFLFVRFQHSLTFTVDQLRDANFSAPMSGLEMPAVLIGLACFVISSISYKADQDTPSMSLS